MLKTAATFLYGSGALYGFVPFEAINSVILGVYPFIAFTWQIKTFGSLLRVLEALINPSPAPSPVFTAGIRFFSSFYEKGPCTRGVLLPRRGGPTLPGGCAPHRIARAALGGPMRLVLPPFLGCPGERLQCPGVLQPSRYDGSRRGAGGHSSIPVLWRLWLSSSCQQKWKKNCTPGGWFDSSSIPSLPPPAIALTGHSPPGLCGRPRDGDVARTWTRLRDRDAACQAYHGAQSYTSPAWSSCPCLFIPGPAIFVLILCFSSAPLHRTWCLGLPWVQMG